MVAEIYYSNKSLKPSLPRELGVVIIFSLFGLGATTAGILLYRSVYLKLRNWTTAPGTIIGYQENHYRNPPSYTPQIQFTSPSGRLITFYSAVGSNRKPYRVGDSVNVIYPPNRPDEAALKSFTNLCLLPTFALFFGVVFTTLGLGLVFGKI